MVLNLVRGSVCACLIVLAYTSTSAVDLEQYREFRLGTSTAVVAATARTADRDLKTLHERPAVLQELTWRPIESLPPGASQVEAVSEAAFSFVDDQLFRIVVAYDRHRTKELTAADMTAALSIVYGPPAALSVRSRAGDALGGSTAIAQWRSTSVTVALQRRDYDGGYTLIVTSLPLERLAQTARAAAVAADAREAPMREAALARQQAEAARNEAARIRLVNKNAFRP